MPQFDRLVQITDLHVQRNPSHNQRVHDRLELLQGTFPGCFLLVTGDASNCAHVDEFAWLRSQLAPWRDRILLLPGNHDYGNIGLEYDERAEEHFHVMRQQLGSAAPGQLVRLNDRYLLVGLDSCCKTSSPIDLAQGRLGGRQLERLDQAIVQAQHQQLIVGLHHDPVNEFWAERLQDANELLKRTWGVAHTVLCGHTHSRFQWTCPRGVPTVLHREKDFGTAQDLRLDELCYVVDLTVAA